MEKKNKLTRLELYWILYDVGNSAFVLMVSTLLPIYFNSLADSAGISSSQYLSYWGYAASVSHADCGGSGAGVRYAGRYGRL